MKLNLCTLNHQNIKNVTFREEKFVYAELSKYQRCHCSWFKICVGGTIRISKASLLMKKMCVHWTIRISNVWLFVRQNLCRLKHQNNKAVTVRETKLRTLNHQNTKDVCLWIKICGLRTMRTWKVSVFVKLNLCTLNHQNIKRVTVREAKIVYAEPLEYQRVHCSWS